MKYLNPNRKNAEFSVPCFVRKRDARFHECRAMIHRKDEDLVWFQPTGRPKIGAVAKRLTLSFGLESDERFPLHASQ